MSSLVQEALAGLVHQFSDPMACFRELIQNAVDANSTEIDVRFGHEDGRLVIDVDDFGDGMDRRIIDSKLTRLFSSSKDDDRTKIGRFGIGFVSVFALQPEVIRIDTSRAGEHWRVIFRPDRSFTRVARDEPVDGTKIRIYRTATVEEARAFAARAREAIRFWCRHVPIEIRVDGRPIGEPFAAPGPCAVATTVGDARIAASYSPDEASFVGYYNRGLTLLEERESRFPGVHLKVWSPELEHTMTRDNVLRDAGYERVMRSAAELIAGPLRARLRQVLVERVPRCHVPGDATEHLLRALAGLRARGRLTRDELRAKILRCCDGSLTDLESAARAARRAALFFAADRTRTGDLLAARGDLVLAAAPGSAALEAITLVGGAAPREVERAWCSTTLLPDHERPAGWPRLAEALARLAGVGGVELGRVDDPRTPAAGRAGLAQPERGGLAPVAELGDLDRGRWLVLNAAHPAIAGALALAASEPELAAMKAMKCFLLAGQALTLARAGELTAAAMEMRWQRTT